MKTARDYHCDLNVVADEITPLPWSEFCESSDWWIGAANPDGSPKLPKSNDDYMVVHDANEMSTQDMLYVVWAANTAPELVKALESAQARVRELEAGLKRFAQHVPGCPMFASFGSDDRLCECGLAALAGEG